MNKRFPGSNQLLLYYFASRQGLQRMFLVLSIRCYSTESRPFLHGTFVLRRARKADRKMPNRRSFDWLATSPFRRKWRDTWGSLATDQRVNRKMEMVAKDKYPYRGSSSIKKENRPAVPSQNSKWRRRIIRSPWRAASWSHCWWIHRVVSQVFRLHSPWLDMQMNGIGVLSHQVLWGLFFVDARTHESLWWAKFLLAKASKRRRSGSLKQGGRPKAVPISGHRVFQDSDL